MAEKTGLTPEEEVTKLRTRVKELEAELDKKDRGKEESRGSTQRTADSWSAASRAKRDAANRFFRGMTLASLEGVRLFADSVSSFAGNVAKRNESGDRKTALDLAISLPGDVAASLADSVADFVDVPARAAEKYSSAYREGEKSKEGEKSR